MLNVSGEGNGTDTPDIGQYKERGITRAAVSPDVFLVIDPARPEPQQPASNTRRNRFRRCYTPPLGAYIQFNTRT